MDKSTLSNYGWVVIVTLVLAVMLALATPFGSYVGKGASNVIKTFVNTSNDAIDEDNIDVQSDNWNIYLNNDELNHQGVIPESGTYTDEKGNTYTKGDDFPKPEIGAKYEYGDYIYTYVSTEDEYLDAGWHAVVKDKTKTTYGSLLHSINGKPLTSIAQCFGGCAELTSFSNDFVIPNTVSNCVGAFINCNKLETLPQSFQIPQNAILCMSMFVNCSSLHDVNLVFPESAVRLQQSFQRCTNLTGTITIKAPQCSFSGTFAQTENPITVKYNKSLDNNSAFAAEKNNNPNITFVSL